MHHVLKEEVFLLPVIVSDIPDWVDTSPPAEELPPPVLGSINRHCRLWVSVQQQRPTFLVPLLMPLHIGKPHHTSLRVKALCGFGSSHKVDRDVPLRFTLGVGALILVRVEADLSTATPTRLEGEEPPFGSGERGQSALHSPLHKHHPLQHKRPKRAKSTPYPIAEPGSSSSLSLPFPTFAKREATTKGPVAKRDTAPGVPLPNETFCWTTWWSEVLRKIPRTWSTKLR